MICNPIRSSNKELLNVACNICFCLHGLSPEQTTLKLLCVYVCVFFSLLRIDAEKFDEFCGFRLFTVATCEFIAAHWNGRFQ